MKRLLTIIMTILAVSIFSWAQSEDPNNGQRPDGAAAIGSGDIVSQGQYKVCDDCIKNAASKSLSDTQKTKASVQDATKPGAVESGTQR